MEDFKSYFKGETSNYVFLVGGVVVMSCGAAVVSYANSILPSDTTKTTVDAVNVSTIKAMKNIGVFFILLGIALMIWYGWALFGVYGGKEKVKARYEAYRKSRAESASTTTTESSGL